jgi:tetratricopeptide (TPR) repeat protein
MRKPTQEKLKTAAQMEPDSAEVHHQYGRALEAAGDLQQAKSEYQESVQLDREDIATLVDLAALMEKQSDWTAAMENYQEAAKKVEALLMTGRNPQAMVDAPGVYKAAQARLNLHLAELKAAGKSSEATALQAQIAAAKAGRGSSGDLDAEMEAGSIAYQTGKFDEAEKSYKEAVGLAQSIRPHDARLVTSLAYLGVLYHYRKDDLDAERTLEEQFKAVVEIYGEGSPQIVPVLEASARFYMERGDFVRAESFAHEELTLAEKKAGNDNLRYSRALMALGYVFVAEKKYDSAKPYLEKLVKIHEQLTGPQRMILVASKRMLCTVYDGLGEPAKAEPCNWQLVTLMTDVYGPNNAALAPVLASQSKELRELGRSAEADDVDKRMQSLQPAAGLNPAAGPTH